MTRFHRTLDFSCRLYGVLLRLYPRRFRERFQTEMVQVFRDSWEWELTHGGACGLLALSWGTASDFVLSLIREWERDVTLPNGQLDYPGLADAFMTTVVVGANLLVWGSVAATVTLQPESVSAGATALTVLAFAVAIGVCCARCVARFGAVEHHRIQV